MRYTIAITGLEGEALPMRTTELDMLHGPLAKKILLFTLPIVLSSLLQQLFNAADTAVVGHFSNAAALAAVGINAEIVALIVTLSAGLAIGVNILVASRIGQNRQQEIPAAVQAALHLSLLLGLAGMLLGQAAARPLLRWMQTPQELLPAAAQ